MIEILVQKDRVKKDKTCCNDFHFEKLGFVGSQRVGMQLKILGVFSF
jgi:hypothetical protein